MKTIAVIGAGISGLAAACFLSRRHRVHLFEQARRLGGRTNTVVVETPTGGVSLDTGFLVHNDRTYPNLVRLFAQLGVATRDSDMSFAVSCRRSAAVAGKAAQAQDELCRQAERYDCLADSMAATLEKPPPVAFSWLRRPCAPGGAADTVRPSHPPVPGALSVRPGLSAPASGRAHAAEPRVTR